ncbi:MAG TPA: hypothetical protein VHE34_25905 [Puia sp.]|uniref:hypothetical protein n=1 Tax=Puia sp. TaxID=2045100 RepID=UPI002CE59DD0|nr:hypothetical protein [Puia sp.]HVU98694.1 hypothetical protein [Puia sp.]
MKSSICLIATLLAAPCVFAQEKVTSVISNNGNTITWTINEPNVKRPSEPFTQIRFQKDDEIYITAGGCAQTGGSGKTWKRYVHPSGDNSAYYYFGKLQIPSVTSGLVRMEQFLNRKLSFTLPPNESSFLTLGYADDKYSDNGYWGHDDGTENQCKGVGNAWVTIAITHHVTPPPPPATFRDFDVVATELDDNGFPLNPKWGKQVNSGQSPDFKNLTDDYPFWRNSGFWCGTHYNFMPVTYQGQVGWEGHSNPIYDDDDYYGAITRADRAIYTTARNYIHWEFNSEETVDNWDGTNTWWNLFHHHAVDASDDAAKAHMDNDSAIVIGLLNIDGQHDNPCELHPVYAMFLKQPVATLDNTFPVPATNSNLVYHFFVRNWGDEGFCSSGQEYLFYDYVRVKIPGAGKMTAANVYKPGDAKYNPMGWSVEYQPDGALLTFHLNSPSEKGWFVGDLAFDRLPGFGQGTILRPLALGNIGAGETEFEAPAMERVHEKLNAMPKARQDTIARQIRQLVAHGIIKKVDADAAPLKVPSKAARFGKFTSIKLPADFKPMHTDDPERNKREELKKQLIVKYVDSTLLKK